MKPLISFAIIGLLSLGASATVTLSGVSLTKPFNNSGTVLPTASLLAMMIVDTTGNGFLGFAPGNSINGTVYSAANDPAINIANMSSTVGGLFGDDTVAAVYTIGGTGINASLTMASGSPYFGKNWAIVFFDTTSITTTSKYGIVRGSDWTMPVSDTGAGITFSNTDSGVTSTFYQITSSAPTTAQLLTGFSTQSSGKVSTVFAVVPEPSIALLGAFGAVSFFRRRRN